jgi:magnesium transporter
MPPTLLASIWGMNYQRMPELDLTWGYPMAICAMIISAIIPLWYFHHKGWMK